MPDWRLPRLRALSITCNQLCFDPKWSSGVGLQQLSLSCKKLSLDPQWTPEGRMSINVSFGPIKADQLDNNAAVQLLKGWKGIELKYVSQGDDCQQVKALCEKLANPEMSWELLLYDGLDTYHIAALITLTWQYTPEYGCRNATCYKIIPRPAHTVASHTGTNYLMSMLWQDQHWLLCWWLRNYALHLKI